MQKVSRISVEKFLSHSTEKFRRETFGVSENFWYRKILCFRGICHDFPSKIFALQYRNISSRNPSVLCFRKFPVAKKFMDEWGGGGEGGSITIFRRKFFVSQCRKISYGKPSVLCFRKFPVAKKFMDKRGVSRFSVENLLSHSAKKFRS